MFKNIFSKPIRLFLSGVVLALALAVLLSFFIGNEKEDKIRVAFDEPDNVRTELMVEEDNNSNSFKIRKRETTPNTRMLVNHNNPLFMFHACKMEGKSYAQALVETYYSLPDDIREFSAVYADRNTDKDFDELLNSFEEILSLTDENNVPVFIQIENYASSQRRKAFSKECLISLLDNHPSLMGFVHVELSCTPKGGEKGITQDEINRLKTSVEACREADALFIWQEMEYENCTNTINRVFENKEIYDLMKSYSRNIIIQDKHNGQGRHFSTQSATVGAWIDGVCDNWGSNVESWLWWEEGFSEYNYMKGKRRSAPDIYTLKYPPSLAGIDTICDMIAGATMYSSENLRLYAEKDGAVTFTKGFTDVLCPLYRRIISGAVPEKRSVISKIKSAYKITSPDDKIMQGFESKLFYGAYAGDKPKLLMYKKFECSKKWLPTTGKYYVIPIFPKYSDCKTVLPNIDIITQENSSEKIGSSVSSRKKFFDSKYEEFYRGTATLFEHEGLIYLFNNSENKTDSCQTAQLVLDKSELETGFSVSEHTYAIIDDLSNGFTAEIVNLRLDTDDVCHEKESDEEFIKGYLDGGKISKNDLRTTVISIYEVDKKPTVTVTGEKNTSVTIDYSESSRIATVNITFNGTAKVCIEK